MPNKKKKLYFLAIIPPSPVYDRIQELRHYVSKKYHSYHALKSPPHITILAPFNMAESKEGELNTLLNEYCSNYSGLDIKLNDFGSFSNKVLYVSVVPNEVMSTFQKNLELKAKKNPDIFNYHYQERDFHPHMTLAFRDIDAASFHEAWSDFKNRTFEAAFFATSLSLLKHDGKEWQIKTTFDFANGADSK